MWLWNKSLTCVSGGQPLHSLECSSHCAYYAYIHGQTKIQKECDTYLTTVTYNMPPKSAQALFTALHAEVPSVDSGSRHSICRTRWHASLCFNPWCFLSLSLRDIVIHLHSFKLCAEAFMHRIWPEMHAAVGLQPSWQACASCHKKTDHQDLRAALDRLDHVCNAAD